MTVHSRRTAAVLAALTLVVTGGGVHAAAAAQDASDPAASAPPPASPPSGSMVRELRQEAAFERAEHRQLLASPARVRARKASTTAFRGLDRAAAARLAQQSFDGLLHRPAAGPLSSGERQADGYVGEFQATLEGVGPNGENGVAVANHPLQVADESGELAPLDVSLQSASQGGWEPVNVGDPLHIAARSSDGMTFASDGLSVAPGGRDVAGTREGESVFYSNVQTDTDAFVKPTTSGAEVFWQLRSASSPQRLTLEVDVPAGASLAKPSHAGVAIVKDGKEIGTISQPVANDADGTSVGTETEVIDDSTIAITVKHHGEDLRYPIIVDPEVASGFYFAYQNDAYVCNQYHWTPFESDNPAFKIETHCNTVAYYGGAKGMYVTSAQWPTVFPLLIAGEQGGFIYQARGQEQIVKAYTSLMMHGHGNYWNDCMQFGIYNNAGWETEPYTNCTGTGPVAVERRGGTPGSPQNRFWFGTTINTTTPYDGWDSNFNAHMRDVEIWKYDGDYPVGPNGAGSPMFEPTASVVGDPSQSLRVRAFDPSTGIASVTFHGPAAWSGNGKTVTNATCNRARCSTSFTASIPVTTTMPQGTWPIRAVVRDAAGNGTEVQVAKTFDWAAPTVQLSGPLYDARGTSVESDEYALAATGRDGAAPPAPQGSGVWKLELLVDGQVYDTIERPCAGGGCSLSNTFLVDMGTLPAGALTVGVRATDVAGRSGVSTFSVTHAPSLVEREPVDASSAPEPDLGAPMTYDYCPGQTPETNPCTADDAQNESLQEAIGEPSIYQEPGELSQLAALTAARYGLANQQPNFFANQQFLPLYNALRDEGLEKLRTTVSWNVLERYDKSKKTDGKESVAEREYARFNAIAEHAASERMKLLVSFEKRRGVEFDDKLPSLADYRDAVNTFRKRYPHITEFVAWNEPNHPTQPTAPVAHPADESPETGPVDGIPRLEWAGRYWAVLRTACADDLDGANGPVKRCTAVAGEFIDRTDLPPNGYDQYLRGTKHNNQREPRIWAYHPYRAGRDEISAPVDNFLRKIDAWDRDAGKAPNVWLTEQGGLVCIRGNGQTAEKAEENLRFLLNLPKDRNRRRITRFYVYQWLGDDFGPGCLEAEFDSGLLDAETGRPRSMYHLFLNRLKNAPEE